MTPTRSKMGKHTPPGEVRLSPPPNIGSARQSSGPSRIDESSGGWPWGTILVLVLLAMAAAGVFVALPRWVSSQQSEPPVGTPASSPAPPEAPSVADGPEAGSSRAAASDDLEVEHLEPSPPAPGKSPPAPAPRKAAIGGTPGPELASRAAMTRGLEALDQEEYEKAREAFQAVLAAYPESREGREGLALAVESLRREHVARQREAALAYEKREAWGDAARSYEAILAVDPALAFALEGRDRAREREKIDSRLRYHLGHPDRLSFEEVLEEVELLLEEASSLQPRGPGMESRIQSLERLASAYGMTVPVVLISDGLTDVMLHRVGRMGRFQTKDLALRPGIYTLVGSRDGFRDVRTKLKVPPGADSASLEIRCQEAF